MKKSILMIMLSLGIAMIGNAGNLTVTATDMTYEMGVGVSAGTEFLCRFDFGSNVLTTDFADGDLTLTSSTTSGEAVSIRSGGTIGDTFVEYRIILGSTGELTTGDKLVLDLSTFGLDSTSYTVTATLMDDFGTFDTAGIHTVTYTPPAPVDPTPEAPAIMIPTLTQWGFALTALIILSLGVFSIRKKHNRI